MAASIVDAHGRFLLQQRPAEKQHGGLWEFPGGKVEPGENPRIALVRELNEELTIRVFPESIVPLAFAESAPRGTAPGIVMQLYKISSWEGLPLPEAGAGLGWFTIEEAIRLPMPPLDVALFEQLAQRAQ